LATLLVQNDGEHQLKEKQWEARARENWGLITFLDGDGLKAGRLMGGALLSAMATGDVGATVGIGA
jgi:hypothetical protein